MSAAKKRGQPASSGGGRSLRALDKKVKYDPASLEVAAEETARAEAEEERKEVKKAKTGGADKKKGSDETKAGQKKTYPRLAEAKTEIMPGPPKPLPKRNAKGELSFPDYPEFKPRLTPSEIIKLGSFGGTYFRPIKSSVTGKSYSADQWKEFPKEWFDGVDIKTMVTSAKYDTSINKYGVNCGAGLDEWESKGWIVETDPYGWFQWYCRFYLGRRSSDDDRQVGRGLRCFGPTGRWRIQLCNRIGRAGTTYDDENVSPVIRQTLQHWGYVLTAEDYAKHAKKNGFAVNDKLK